MQILRLCIGWHRCRWVSGPTRTTRWSRRMAAQATTTMMMMALVLAPPVMQAVVEVAVVAVAAVAARMVAATAVEAAAAVAAVLRPAASAPRRLGVQAVATGSLQATVRAANPVGRHGLYFERTMPHCHS